MNKKLTLLLIVLIALAAFDIARNYVGGSSNEETRRAFSTEAQAEEPAPEAAAPAPAPEPRTLSENEEPEDEKALAEKLRREDFSEKNPVFTFPERKKRYLYSGPDGCKAVALSFDDGPHPRYTRPLLAVLKEKNVPATFFLLGRNARAHPEIVDEILEAGCEVGNHSDTHPNLRKLDAGSVREELDKAQKAIIEAGGVAPICMRMPYGYSGQEPARVAYEMKLDIIYWSIDTDDYMSSVTKDDIVKNVLENAGDGSIILMHDKSRKVVDAVRELIDPLREKGFRFVTCSEMARINRLAEHEKSNAESGKDGH